jgi:hypothetical protein
VADALREREARFDPSQFGTFRFVSRELADDGRVTLRYALDDLDFAEQIDVPVDAPVSDADRERVDGLLALLHWTAGVSYFKAAAPASVSCESGKPPPAAARLLEALYSEGLGEFAYVNELPALPRPTFEPGPAAGEWPSLSQPDGPRLLVPVGGGKDSVVALEIARRSGRDVALFSVGDAVPIVRTVAVAGLPHLLARRRIDPRLIELNRAGALNGHVPVTAIVTCIAMLTAALNGFDTVAMANERSASQGNVHWDGIEVNHQFSKGLRAERLLRAAVAELAPGMEMFSLLRPASELGIARAFAGLAQYHPAFTSCNAVFRLDPELRATSWCRDCPKCRFVYLALAPFSEPEHLREVFGGDMLAEPDQYDGFALLTATGGNKPFECVGEEEESLAAIRLLAEDPRWRDHAVVARLVAEVLPLFGPAAGDPETVLALSGDHEVPDTLIADVDAVLGA